MHLDIEEDPSIQEVGHLNIGAGRIVYQDLAKINLACEDNSISVLLQHYFQLLQKALLLHDTKH